MVSADLNGDGKADLVSANMSGNSITVLLANSSGGFTAASGSPVAVGAGPQSVAVADVNGDGKPDLIAANTTASTLTILIGDGTGRFTATVGSPLATASPVSFLAVGDFNGDGKTDIATVNVGSDSVSILLGNGAGGFVAATGSPFAVGLSPRSLAIGDLNIDGRLDIVVANYLGNSVTVLLGDGSGGFIATNSGPVAVGASPASVLLLDLNGDGKPDIVTANAADNNLSLLAGDGLGGFTAFAGASPQTGTRPVSVAAGDFNGDGNVDLVAVNSADGSLTVLFGNGAGLFAASPGSPYSVGSAPSSLTVGDFNGDGKPEVATANSGDGTLSAFLNSLPSLTAAFPSLSFYAATGQTTIAAIPVRVTSATAGAVYAVRPEKSWLSATPASNATGGATNVSISVSAASLSAGVYTGVVRFNAPNFFGSATAVTLSVSTPSGNLQEAAASPFSTGTTPQAAAVADFNGDGNPDLATANYTSNTVTVLLGNGFGGFVEAGGSPFATGLNPAAIVIADFNGDGKPDIAVANSGASSVTVLLGNGSGGFTAAAGSPFAVGSEPIGIVAADFNRDGKADLVTANNLDQSLTVLLGTGSGGFVTARGSPALLGSAPVAIASGDFDLDGKADIVTAAFTGKVSVIFGNGAGGFSNVRSFAAGTTPQFVAVADLNGDGKPDLVTANFGGNNVSVLLGDGSGGFAPAPGSPVTVGTNPRAVALVDLNGDGKPDILTANVGNDTLSVLLGTGSGTFTAAGGSPFAAGSTPFALATGDFNSDGRTDVAVVNVGASFVTLLLGKSVATSSALTTTTLAPVPFGTVVPFTLRVTQMTAGFAGPTGTAVLLDGGATVGPSAQSASPYTFSATLGGGVHMLTATFNGDAANTSSTSNSVSITVTPANQTITFGTLAGRPWQAAPFSISAMASSGIPVTFVSLTGSVCTVSGNSVTMLTGGTCTMEATQAGNSNYKAATPADQSFKISPAAQTITFAPLPNLPIGSPPFTVSATASSGLAVVFTSTTNTICTVSGTTVTMVAGGSCSIQAAQPGNVLYAAAASVSQRFQITPGTQTITFASLSDQGFGSGPVMLTATASSGLPVSYVSTTSTICTVSGSTVTLLKAGVCTITGSQSGNAGYAAAAPVTQSFNIGIGAQTITFNAIASRVLGSTPMVATATASSGLAVAFASNSQAVCSVSGVVVTLLSTGSCSITASQAGNANYFTAQPVDQSFQVTPGTQVIAFAALQGKTFGVAPLTVSATSSAGLPVTFLSTTPAVCSVSGTIVTLTGVGACTIQATQPGNVNYSAASSMDQTFTVAQGTQTITFAALQSQPFSTAQITLNATASSGLPVTFTSKTLSVCTVSGTSVSLATVGACSIQAGQPGNSTFSAAASVTQQLMVTFIAQAITFGPLSTASLGTPPFALSATASSGLPVTFTSTPMTVCTVSSGTLTMVGAGNCIVQAVQAGDATRAAAAAVKQSFTVIPGGQTISFDPLPDQAMGTPPFALTATASSGLAVSFTSATSTVCIVSGIKVALVRAGDCSIQAAQAGNTGYTAATPVLRAFAVVTAAPVFIASVLSAGSYAAAPLSPEGYTVMFGSNFSTFSAQAAALPLPTMLAGTMVMITDSAGGTKSAQLNYVSPTQINFLVPKGLASGAAIVNITTSAGKKASFPTTVAPVSPALFTADASGKGAPAALALHFTSGAPAEVLPVFGCTGSPVTCSATPIDLGPPSAGVYLELFGTGIRGRSSLSSVTVFINGLTLPVSFAGAQADFAGLDQVNVLLDRSLMGKGILTLQLTVDGIPANPVAIQIK